jgi:arylsulfatase A-like enzyme
MIRSLLPFLLVLLGTLHADGRPNILVFYVDDMGWAQPGCYGGTLAATPHIDALAAHGTRFTDGYVSACICGPSRVGLMTGRYQARTGHDANGNRAGRELLLSETTLAQRLKDAGYATAITGKWHLGDTDTRFLPVSRGFDVSLGALDNLGEGRGPRFYRGAEMLEELDGAPITSPVFAREAVSFIESRRGQPWFLYLPFNAIHTPHVASPEWLARFAHVSNPRDRNYAALIAEADAAIGTVMAKVRELGLEENTLVFCISDNGGAALQAEMGGLRGRKWFLWEGGIRVPFIVQWKGRIPAGRVIHDPVIQLDVMPTALAAAGVSVPAEWELDGVNLLPILEGGEDHLAPRDLFFRFGAQHAVRSGQWKLVKAASDMEPMLVSLSEDPGEQTDLSARFPEKKCELAARYEAWNAGMTPPRWVDARWDGTEDRKKQRRR